ncbi:MAG: hypothetical protein HRT89_03560, partial [Lentisphaeria bacterium]|nr:hypothetical protein [Lentisphaeria bacterium]
YAESEDGIHFKPKRVGTCKYNGNTRNNLVSFSADPDISGGMAGGGASGFLYDPMDKDFPYKVVILRRSSIESLNPAVRARFPKAAKTMASHSSSNWFIWGVGKSKDGFEWQMPEHDHLLIDEVPEGPVIHRALDGGYVIGNQMVSPTSKHDGRRIKGWLTYDQQTAHRIPEYVFSMPESMTRCRTGEIGPAWNNSHWAQNHVGLVTARKGPSMIALHGTLYGAWAAETYAQVADIGLAVSDTGYHFEQVWPFRPFLRRGERQVWDYGLVWQCAMEETSDKTLFYYGASNQGNAAGSAYNAGVGYVDKDRFGFRALRVNRDYSEPKKRRGEVTLQPCVLPEKPELTVNCSHLSRTRTVRVELRRPDGKVIPGFSFKNCSPVCKAGIHRPLRWTNKNVRTLAGKEVQIAVELFSPDCQFGEQQSPRVYAIYTSQRKRS